MTTHTELLEIISNGENSGVEFKRDVLANHDLAKELVAFSNLSGGIPRKIILGMQKHNQTVPDLIEEHERFILRLLA